MENAPQHQRTSQFILAGFERRVLPWLAARLPAWVVPDHLTALGLAASTFIAISYMLTNRNPAWLWAASAGLVVPVGHVRLDAAGRLRLPLGEHRMDAEACAEITWSRRRALSSQLLNSWR